MPYKIVKQKCKQKSGDSGKYVIRKKPTNKKVSCHKTKDNAQKAIKAMHAAESINYHDDIEVLTEKIFERILLEYLNEKRKFNGSHPDESYQEFDESWFDKKGLTTWDDDRQTVKNYLKDIGLL